MIPDNKDYKFGDISGPNTTITANKLPDDTTAEQYVRDIVQSMNGDEEDGITKITKMRKALCYM